MSQQEAAAGEIGKTIGKTGGKFGTSLGGNSISVPKGQIIGNTIEVFDEIDSTNEQAKKIAKNAREE